MIAAYDGIGLGQSWDLIECSSEEEWLSLRQGGVGASESACLLGLSPYTNAFALYQEKLGLTQREQNPAMRWGQLVESAVAELAREALGVERLVDMGRHTLLRSTTNKLMLATLDRLCPPIPGQTGWGVAELKVTRNESLLDSPPVHYQAQVQHQLAVSGLQWGALAIACHGKIGVHVIARNDRFIQMLSDAVKDFWVHVETKFPPSIEAGAATTEALRHIADNGMAIEIDARELDDELQTIEKQLKGLENRKAILRDQLVAMIGTASRARIRGVPVEYRFSTVKRKEHLVKASESRSLRRAVLKEEIQ